jgi:hypothetical protein
LPAHRHPDPAAVAGEAITDRLVSLADPDARPIRKGKLGKPNEFGSVAQLAEVTANTGRGARGYVLPAASTPGNPGENRLLPQTVAELDRLGLTPREVALDGGFVPWPTTQTLAGLAPTRIFISGRAEPGSRRTRRRLARYRTGCEGRISYLKRGYGLRRSRLRGDQGQLISDTGSGRLPSRLGAGEWWLSQKRTFPDAPRLREIRDRPSRVLHLDARSSPGRFCDGPTGWTRLPLRRHRIPVIRGTGAPQNGIDHADGSCLPMTVRQTREPMTTGRCWRRGCSRAANRARTLAWCREEGARTVSPRIGRQT